MPLVNQAGDPGELHQLHSTHSSASTLAIDYSFVRSNQVTTFTRVRRLREPKCLSYTHALRALIWPA